MSLRKSEIIMLGIALLSFVIGVYYYPQMPESTELSVEDKSHLR